MKTFVTSDTHFGHQNIIKYANRPFTDWREMGEAMIERWNRSVQPEDTVYFLGDFAMGPGAKEDYVVEVLNRLNGFKRMILGNHDQPSKWSKGLLSIVMDYGFDNAIVLDDQIHGVKIDGKNFVMCHFPLTEWDQKHHGSVHLHGHTHTEFRVSTFTHDPSNLIYDIGVDMYGGPVEVTGDLRYLNDPKGWSL